MSAIRSRLQSLFDRFHRLTIIMMGDFFIDQYLDLAREYSETSLETGLEAYQVVGLRNSLGAAGTVANNLQAMSVNVKVLTLCGDDPNGFLMQQLMQAKEIRRDGLVIDPGVYTPSYLKPMMTEPDGSVNELNRMDIKNRRPIGPKIEAQLTQKLESMVAEADALLVTDQVAEAECGVVTSGMRKVLSELARSTPGLPIWVDSRERGSLYEGVSLKTNLSEAKKALQIGAQEVISAETAAAGLFQKNQKPVMVTDGENGIAYCDEKGSGHVPALKREPPLDTVGAGDSVQAGIGLAMAVGATVREAALIGCLAASVTIKKIGTTGTASIPEMLENLSLFEAQYPAFRL